jgi:hypothetical protein
VVDYLEDIAKRTKTTVARVLADNKLSAAELQRRR